MSREVEVSLRVPNMKVRALDENGYPIDHANVRFRKMIQVPSIPKPDETLELTTRSGRTLPARVVRADWHESRELFVLSCQYAERSITAGRVRRARRRSRVGVEAADLGLSAVSYQLSVSAFRSYRPIGISKVLAES